jgi:hypothetical protein
MDLLTGHIVIISRAASGDEEGWMQILVFVVLGVFWAVGQIVKNRAAKTQQEKQKQQPKPRPQPRPRLSLERFLQAEPEKTRTGPMQARAAKMARQLARDKAVEQAMKKPKQEAEPFYKSVVPESTEIKPLEERPTDKATALAALEWTGVEIGTTEQLRAAMLHFEIFGKCVGLREAKENVWMR